MSSKGGEEMNGLKKKRAGAIGVAALLVVVGLVAAAPAGATGKYTDKSGDNGAAPDVLGVTVSNDATSGQVLFQISGVNLSSSDNDPTFLDIDSDANPLTGDLGDGGADYSFIIGGESYGFWHFNGSDWVDTSYSTVRIFGSHSLLNVSVNKSEIGNTSDFNFSVTSIDVPNKAIDSAPDDGMFNYSLDDGGPKIESITLATTPAAGPKAGKKFVVTPTGLTLPPSGATQQTTPTPESYTCQATLNGRALKGAGIGGCTFNIAKKKTKGKTLKVTVTVQYEGASKAFPYTFKVR
jgi:hypothetical protein